MEKGEEKANPYIFIRNMKLAEAFRILFATCFAYSRWKVCRAFLYNRSMLRTSAKFAVFVLLCTLSLQGFAAVAMPFCQHQTTNPRSSDGGASSGVDHATHQQHATAGSQLACDDCAFCQLCAAPALPGFMTLSLPDLAVAFNPEPPIHFFLFVPKQTQHPPLS